MANPARLISIDDHPLFSDLEYQIFNDPISRTNSLSGDSDVPTLAETIIFHIPPEIIDQILTYLPLEDKACFIITCSHYYPRYKSFLEGKSLRECRPLEMSDHNPFLMKRPKKIYSKVDVDARPKAKLLRRLENDRWKFCLDCWKLHPTSQSAANTDTDTDTDSDSDSDSDPETETETDKDSPEEKSCMQKTGVIKFCPCVDLTPTDCKSLNTSLMAMKTDEWEDSEKYYQELFDLAWPNNYWDSDDGKDDDDDNHFSLYHYCPSEAWFKDHPFKRIDVKKEITNVYWIEREILRVRLEIRFELPRGMSALYAFTWLFEYFEKDKKWAGYFDKVSTDGKHYIRLENEEYLGAERRLF